MDKSNTRIDGQSRISAAGASRQATPDSGHGAGILQFPYRYFACQYCELQEVCVNAAQRGGRPSLAGIIEHPRPYHRGDHLFRQGDPVRHFYVINSGITKQYITTADGSEQVVNFTLVGESVSLDYLEGGRHNSNVTALDTTGVCAIPLARLNRDKQLKAALADYLLRHTAREIVRSHELQQLIGQGAAENKLAYFINDMILRMDRTGRPGDSVVLPMSRHDIANYLCLADETVSRLFSRFADWGIIKVDRKRITISDSKALRALADGHCHGLSDSA